MLQLRAIADTTSLLLWLGQFLRDGRLIIFGLLIVIGATFFPQGLVTPSLFKRRKRPKRSSSGL